MRNIRLAAIASVMLLLGTGAAQAMSIPFTWNGGSITATGALAVASYSPTSGSVSLDDGEGSGLLNFGTVSLIGLGEGILEVAVDFVTPDTNPASPGVSGAYRVFSVFFFSGGTWEGGSTIFDYTHNGYAGQAELSMLPIDTGLQIGPSFTVYGAIKNLGTRPVSVALSEPVYLGALGLAFVSIMVLIRRRAQGI